MRLALLSDLHLEFKSQVMPKLAERVDVLVLAGDVNSAAKAVPTALEVANGNADHVVLVAGNHEFYGTRFDKGLTRLQKDADELGVHFLHNRAISLNGVNFLGGTLWTDYRLDGTQPLDMLRATDYMNDHRRIKFKAEGEVYRRFLPKDALAEHQETKAFLMSRLAAMQDEPSVVVTHHAPSRVSVHDKYRFNQMNSAYASSLEDILFSVGPDLWLHGHMHDPADYELGRTRVVCNPHGYPSERENPDFQFLSL